MPQGKMKIKAKLPEAVKVKKKVKGLQISKRGNAPNMPKKLNTKVEKLKNIITKTVNASAEKELRAIALDGKKSLSSKINTTQS